MEDGAPQGCALPVPEKYLKLEWLDVAASDTVAASLDEHSADIRVTNDRDQAVVVRLDETGHRGTTRTLSSDLGSLELDAHESAVVAVSLDPYLAGDSPYSRAVVIGAVSEDPETGERLETSVGSGLFFHELPGGDLAAYNGQTLIDTYAGGDYDGVAEASLDAQGVRETIVEWEAPEAEGPVLEAQGAPPDDRPRAVDGDFPVVAPPRDTSDMKYYLICVDLKVRHEDSGFTNSQGIDEDLWEYTDVNSLVPAHGMKIKLDGTTYDLSKDGCVGLWHEDPWFATVDVHTRSTLSNGAYVRIHKGPPCTSGTWGHPNCNDPSGTIGYEYVWTATNVYFQPNLTNYVEAGKYTTRFWTTMASFAKSLKRYHAELPSDTHIHVSVQNGCDPDPMCDHATEYCCLCGENSNYHNDPDDKDSYIYMTSYQCPTVSLRDKFIAAHEYIHAYTHQVAGVETQVPASATLDVDSDCYDQDGFPHEPYKNHTIEWSSLAFREGWAHFGAARVWNHKGADGQFRWGSENFDLERYHTDDIPEGTEPGGHLENVCCISLNPSECATETAGAGVIPDWMRGLWDLHTTFEGQTCNDQPTLADLADIVSDVLNYDPQVLDNDNFFDVFGLVLWLRGSDCQDEWDDIGEHNGLDH